MAFDSFVVLLAIAVVAAAALHYGAKLYIRDDRLSLAAKVAWSYIGAFLGEQVFGDWFARATFHHVPLIPAMLGAVVIQVMAVDLIKTLNAAKS